jgi:HlyD family secretion protein
MTSSNRRFWPKTLLMMTAVIAMAGIGWYFQRSLQPSQPAYQITAVSRGELVQLVTANGQLNPVTKVEVGSQISGNIQKLLVDYNAAVKQGQLIARLDPAIYEANFIQAEGNLANAKAGLELARLNADRARTLRENKLNPQADYDKALADLHQAEAIVKINEGTLRRAQVDLDHCSIFAPIDGVVISRNVNVGQTVAASLSAPTLFVIANDLSKMQIEANVAEADIGLVGIDQPVEFTVDAFPGRTFRGQVVQIRNAPRTDQTVVTYDTIIAVNNPDLKLKPGMTANVSIEVARRQNALKVPNAALRFRPPDTVKKTESTAGPTDSASNTTHKSSHKKDKRKTERMVYVLTRENSAAKSSAVPQRSLHALAVKTGLTDGKATEVLEGLNEGDEVVTAMSIAKASVVEGLNPFIKRKRN